MLRLQKFKKLQWLSVFLAAIFLSGAAYAGGVESITHEGKYIFGKEVDKVLKMVIASIVMLSLIIVIAMEKIHRTMVAMLGGGLLILFTHTLGNYFDLFHFITFDQAFVGGDGHKPAVDYEVIGLLAGMMIVVGVLSETGVFEWLALKLFKLSHGKGIHLVILFFLVTAGLSAFLDNVTTVILITPIALQITRILKINPFALMMPIILASNIGGTATLIGDPPNILIGAYSGLSFNAFLQALGFPIIIILVIILIQMCLIYRKDLTKNNGIDIQAEALKLEKTCFIEHPKLLKTSLVCLAGIIVMFFLHHMFHMSPAVPAIAGAAVLMFFRDRNIINRFKKQGRTKEGIYEGSIEEMEVGIIKAFEKDVEWSVLAFFAFLFVCVGALEHSGSLDLLANYISTNFGDDLLVCSIVILWVAAIASSFLDNIPFTIVMLPVIGSLLAADGAFGGVAGNNLLWWSLALGACLGGNGTVIAASANIVTVGMMEKEGIKMSFMDFFKIGFPSMLIQVSLATVAVILMHNLGLVV